jgi:L-threonylcarbamoyladenylate synthase
VGVESTIIDLTCTPPRLLRPGGVTLEQLREALGAVDVDAAVTRILQEGEKPRAPGMKYRHYAPEAPVTVVTGDPDKGAAYIAAQVREGDGVICFDEYADRFRTLTADELVMPLGPAADKSEQARRVFDALRKFDHTDARAIWAQCPDASGIGLAIANRLNKAAGFHIIEV